MPSAREKHKSRKNLVKEIEKNKTLLTYEIKKSWPYLELPYHSIDQSFVLKKQYTGNF